MEIPPFIQVEHDEAARKAIVSVQDKEVRKQREMWGECALLNATLDLLLRNPQAPFGHTYKTISWEFQKAMQLF
jgi:hypothetical protein